MALQLKKYEPLPDLVVQGNNYQAPNVSVPAPAAPVTTPNIAVSGSTDYYHAPNYSSWNTAPRVPNLIEKFAQDHLINPVKSQINNFNNSVTANLVRVAAADLTNNDTARTNANVRLKVANQELNKQLKDPQYIANIAGAVGGTPNKSIKPKVTLTKKELTMGRALGMKPKDIQIAKTEYNLPKVVSTAASKMSPEELANLKPGEQMAIDQLRGAGPPSKAPAAVNAAKNPYKPNVREVIPGDYAGARLAGQQLSQPIKAVGSRWEYAMNKLKKSSPDEFSNFWRHTEDPNHVGSQDFQTAKGWWREISNRAHGSSVAVGPNTNYLKDWALHPWQLKDGEQLASGGAGVLGTHAQERIFRTIGEGEQAGFALGKNPIEEGMKYVQGASSAVERLAAKKALTEADALAVDKPRTLDLGYGHTVQLSKEGFKQAKALEFHRPTDNKAIVALRTGNAALKSSTLSLSQFHTANIAGFRAAPALALKGKPVRATKGLYGTVRAGLPGGKGYANRILSQAHADKFTDAAGKQYSYIDAGATLGMPYGQAGYNVAGTKLKSGIGHKLVFERQLPMMHNQVVRAIVDTLNKKGIALESDAARKAGVVGDATMGFINKEALNISPKMRQGMSDFMLAGQFTPSKIVTLRNAGRGGVAGSYARADVAANAIAALAVVGGVGYLVHQKSDSARDLVLRALINPAVPTPYKDAKGNNQELRTPMTYTSEVSHFLGIKLKRGADGHLAVNWKAGNAPGTITDWMRSRLSPGASDVTKVATHKNFASKPLYDPNAPAGTKAAQAATTLTQGHLPIGTQGLAYTSAVKNKLPGTSKEILNANTPGSNAVLKSGLSSVGFTPRTDQTVGKGLETSRYFSALDDAKKGLNSHEKAVLELYAGNKKNPVTGKYDVQPNVNDTSTKAKALLDQPKVIDKLIAMNASLKSQGQKIDPLWTAGKEQITKALQYQTMPPGGADKSHWLAQNESWYQPLSDQRSSFFNSLPKGDPNKPTAPVEYPSPTTDVVANQKTFFGITDSAERAKFLINHPEVQTQLDKQVEYNNKMREAQGYSALDTFPSAAPGVQKVIDTYNALPKNDGPKGGSKTRSLWIQAHPKEYASMTQYFTQASLYSLEKDAGQAQFKDTGFSQKGLKDIYNLGQYDVSKTTDANGNTFYALGSGSSSGGSGSSSYTKYSRYTKKPPQAGSAYKHAVSLSAGGRAKRPKVSIKGGKIAKTGKVATSKPKVSIKASKV